jgi:hypothetical protein
VIALTVCEFKQSKHQAKWQRVDLNRRPKNYKLARRKATSGLLCRLLASFLPWSIDEKNNGVNWQWLNKVSKRSMHVTIQAIDLPYTPCRENPSSRENPFQDCKVSCHLSGC